MAMAAPPCCARLSVVRQILSLCVLYRHVQSKEFPATTEVEWRRRHSSPGHKGGPETVLFNVQGVV